MKIGFNSGSPAISLQKSVVKVVAQRNIEIMVYHINLFKNAFTQVCLGYELYQLLLKNYKSDGKIVRRKNIHS